MTHLELGRKGALFALSLILLFVFVPVSVSSQSSAGNLVYFHYHSLLYRNPNSSVVVLSEANLSPPNSSVPQVIDIAGNLRNSTAFGPVWVGSVSWIGQSFPQSEYIQGPVTITAWLSSNDSQPPLSGIGGGMVIVDSRNNVIGQPAYGYLYGSSAALTSQPKSYQFKIPVNWNVQQGQRIIFAVGLGASVQGWKMRVYFDSLQYPTSAQLPESLVFASETSNPIMTAVAAFVTVAIASLVARRSRNRSS